MLTQHEILICLSLAVCGYTITNILMATGEVLDWYRDLLAKLYAKKLSYIAKPLGYCAKCLSGQLAMWAYLYLSIGKLAVITLPLSVSEIDVIAVFLVKWFVFILLTIFLTQLTTTIITKWQQH